MDKLHENYHKDISRGVEKCSVACCRSISTPEQVVDFVYVRSNVPGPGFPRKLFKEQLSGCDCQRKNCAEELVETCSCVQQYGLVYDLSGHLTTIHPWEETMTPILECNRDCACSASCSQRVVQHGLQLLLEVFPTTQKGFGLRTRQDVSPNTFICEYAGEVLSAECAKMRYNSAREDAPNYILALNEHCANDQITRTYVDPTYIGNLGRFINHACEPNLFMLPVRVDHILPRLALFSLRALVAGEELTYDYSGKVRSPSNNTVSTDSVKEGDARSDIVIDLQGKNGMRKPCYCGSKGCLGMLPYEPSLEDTCT